MTVLIFLAALLAGVILGAVLRGPGKQHGINAANADCRALRAENALLRGQLSDTRNRLAIAAGGGVTQLPGGAA